MSNMYKFFLCFIYCVVWWIILDFFYEKRYKYCNSDRYIKKKGCKNWMCKHAHDCYVSKYCNVGDGEYYLPELEREYKKRQKKGLK